MLTLENITDIERVKIALKVILSDRYSDYDKACSYLNTKSLQSRRIDLSLNFTLKCLKSLIRPMKQDFTVYRDTGPLLVSSWVKTIKIIVPNNS